MLIDSIGPACDHEASGLILTMPRGGWREGAGRPAAYPHKVLDDPFPMDFTSAGRAMFDKLQARTSLSRNDIIAHLALTYADELEFRTPGVVFPIKAQEVYRICVPEDAGDKLRRARTRTGKSYSDIGEALVCWYGPVATFPVLKGKDKRKRKRGRKRGRR